jgi:hypothetical protein
MGGRFRHRSFSGDSSHGPAHLEIVAQRAKEVNTFIMNKLQMCKIELPSVALVGRSAKKRGQVSLPP